MNKSPRDGAMAMGMEQMIAPLHTPKPRPRAPLTPPPPSPADLAGRWSATGRMVCEWQACWSVRRQLSAASRKSRVRSLARRLRTSLGAGQGGWCGCLHTCCAGARQAARSFRASSQGDAQQRHHAAERDAGLPRCDAPATRCERPVARGAGHRLRGWADAVGA